MNRSYLNYLMYGAFVFIQVFFIDNFDFKIGLILFPLLINVYRGDLKQLVNNSCILFIFSDFFRNNFVSVALLIFLICNFIINQFSKFWSKEVMLFVNFFVVFLIYNVFSFGILNSSFFGNLFMICIFIVIRRVLKSGYFRFN